MKRDYLKCKKTGVCPTCGINCWAEHNNQPAIWPCRITGCPFPDTAKIIQFPVSSTGSSLLQITN
jgi:hypothetical protein